MKRLVIKLSVIFILFSLAVSTIYMVPALQESGQRRENTKEQDKEISIIQDEEEVYQETSSETNEEETSLYKVRDEFLEKYGIKEDQIDLSSGLMEKMMSTPEYLWSETSVQLILMFDDKSRLINEKLIKFCPEILETLPLAIINTNLAKISDIYKLKGIKGVYLNEQYQIADDWKPYEIMDKAEFHTYPSEALIGARDLLDLGIDGTGVKIAIIDTGIDKTHPDLDDIDNDPYTSDPKVILEKSFIDYNGDGIADTDTSDGYGHGTHCAGIAAGNGILKGVAPNAWLINARVGDDYGQVELSWLLRAIDWAVVSGADIISMSLGWGIYNVMSLLDEAANYAWERGVILTVSAGNSGSELRTTGSPGTASRSITVGASTKDNTVTDWSSRGPSINGVIDPDVVAPGEDILSTYPSNRYYVASGTSMSAPAVAGVTALLISAFPDEDIGLIRSAIIGTATDLGYHIYIQGAGLVNAKAAYEYLQHPSVYAFPNFAETSVLTLNPGEKMDFQFDVYLNATYTSFSIEPSVELSPYLLLDIIDPVARGWVRTKISVIMPNESINSTIEIKDGSTVIHVVPLCLVPGIEQNDANSGTDAGESLSGAISVTTGEEFSGQVFSDGCDFYSFEVIENQVFGINSTWNTGEVLMTLHDENGTRIDYNYVGGQDIGQIFHFKAYSSGEYFLNILNYDYEPVNYTILPYATGENDTLATGLTLLGNYDDYGIDEDEDGIYEALAITLEVNIETAGEYAFYYSIHQKRMDYNFPKYLIDVRSIMFYLEKGVNEITLLIDGLLIEASGYNGPYIIGELMVLDYSKYEIPLSEYEVYTTSYYRSNWFVKMPNGLLSYYLEDVNIDNSNNPEMLKVVGVFRFTKADIYNVRLDILDSSQYFVINRYYEQIEVLEPGIFLVSFTIIPQGLEISGDIVLACFSSNDFEEPIYIFKTVNKNRLLSYDPILTYSILDKAVDTDSNGALDSIEFTFIVNSKLNGEISIYMSTAVSLVNETYVEAFVSNTDHWIIGGGTLKSTWEATRLRRLQIFAPLLFADLSLYLSNDDYSLRIECYYVTNSYNYLQFEFPNAIISGYLGDEKFSTNETAGYKLLFEITATKTVEVRFRVSIVAYDSEDYFYEGLETYITVFEGKNNITLTLDYTAFISDKYRGDLLIAYTYLYRVSDDKRLDSLENVGIIEEVDYLDYVNYFDAYIIDFHTELIDDNTNGLYEGVNLHFTVNVSKPAEYNYVFYSYGFISSIYIDSVIEFNTTGLYNITFLLSAEQIVKTLEKSLVDGAFIIKRDTETYYWMDMYYYQIEINKTEFEYKLPFEVLSVFQDYAFDSNEDGLFEGIEFTLEVNNTLTEYFDFRILVGLNVQVENTTYRMDELYYGKSGTQIAEGIQLINYTIQASDLAYVYNRILMFGFSPILDLSITEAIILEYGGMQYYAVNQELKFNNSYNLEEFDMRPAIEINEVITQLDEPIEDYIHNILITVVYQVNRATNFEIELYLRFNEYGSSYEPSDFNSHYSYPSEMGEFNYTFNINLDLIYYSSIPEKLGIIVSSVYIKDLTNQIIDSYHENNYIYYNMYFSEVTETTPLPTTTSSNAPTLLIGSLAVITMLFIKKRRRK